MNFVGTGKRLQDEDLPRIGHMIEVGEDEIHAILDVEAAGRGFDSKDRLKMLYEPHIFYRQLKDPNQLRRAIDQGLAYKKWGTKRYPRDSYPRLEQAMRINTRAALMSCSWGLGQTMGFNYSLCGFESPQKMVEAYLTGEAAQLEGMINFIISAGLDDELRRHDWAGFARGYNGPGYAKHGYHTRLAKRFKFWQGKPDTPWNPDMLGQDAPEPEFEEDDTPAVEQEPQPGCMGSLHALNVRLADVEKSLSELTSAMTSMTAGLTAMAQTRD